MLIGISGKIGSGKDLVGNIIRYLTSVYVKGYYEGVPNYTYHEFIKSKVPTNRSPFVIKKYADKLKDIVCLLINCTREQLESQVFKDTPLSKEWEVHYALYSDEFETKTLLFNSPTDRNNWINDLSDSFDCRRIWSEILTPRKLLQLLGTDCGRNIIHPNIWINSTMSEYIPEVSFMCDKCENENITHLIKIPSRFKEQGYDEDEWVCPYCKGEESEGDLTQVINDNSSNWIITDVRFPNEALDISHKDGIVIRINSNYIRYDDGSYRAKNKMMGDLKYEPYSETALDDYDRFDYIIDNNGTIEELIEKVKEILIKENIIC